MTDFEKILEQIEQPNEVANNKIKWIDKSKEEYRDYLKSLLESHKELTTAEKLLKIQPFIQELEKYTWQELKSRLWFWWPNNRFEDEWWGDYLIDNPHRYGFAKIEWLYNPRLDDGVYFRIDTLQWSEDESRYIRCKPTLTIDNIKITLNLKNTQDELLNNARVYNRLLRDRLSNEQKRDIRNNKYDKITLRDHDSKKRISSEPIKWYEGKISYVQDCTYGDYEWRRPRRRVCRNDD